MGKLSKDKTEKHLEDLAQRKKDHIELAFESRVNKGKIDSRFYYEPILSGHPAEVKWEGIAIGTKKLKVPIWVSSMTGGTDWAKTINTNLAKACNEFGMGMGLGSCRPILYDNEYLQDFAVRSLIGDNQIMMANLGVAQIEELIASNRLNLIRELVQKLEADGLIIHVNPLQEWLQPEGDRFKFAPIESIEEVLNFVDFPIIVKEVGQGMGYASLKALLQLPLAAVDFAANGGTNFAKLELLRSDDTQKQIYAQLANVGHGAEEMTMITNKVVAELGDKVKCQQIIISGGIQSFLDGYYLIEQCNLPSAYGQASAFLKHSRGDYDQLSKFVQAQVDGLAIAKAYLRVKTSSYNRS